MKHLAKSCHARSCIGIAALAFSGVLFLSLDPAAAQGCGGGPLSTSTGNLAGSAVGAVAGGVLGNQFGHGSGKGVMTGVGVVGGALAGGYVGRSMEGCDRPSQPPPAPAAYSPPPGAPAAYGAPPGAPVAAAGPQTCRYVLTQAQIDGRPQQINAIACLAPDGSWQTRSDAGAQRAAEADLVFRAQQQLRQQGFYVRDNIDGQWGPATSTAVRNFQRANGLQITAQLDVPTQTALGLNAAPLGAAPVAAGGPPGPPEPYPASPTPSAGIVPAGAAR